MGKTAREDLMTLRAIAPIARNILDAAEACERALSLKATIEKMERRKAELSTEVADSLAKADKLAKAIAEATAAVETARAQREQILADQQASFAAADAARTTALEQSKADHERVRAGRIEEMNVTLGGLRREIADLTAQRDGLKREISDTLSKYGAGSAR